MGRIAARRRGWHAGLVALVVGLVMWDRVQGSESPSAEGPAIEARTDLSPRTVFFGDTVPAAVEVTLDPNRVDPDSSSRRGGLHSLEARRDARAVAKRNRRNCTSLRVLVLAAFLGNRCIRRGRSASSTRPFSQGACDVRSSEAFTRRRSSLQRHGRSAPRRRLTRRGAPPKRRVPRQGGGQTSTRCSAVTYRMSGRSSPFCSCSAHWSPRRAGVFAYRAGPSAVRRPSRRSGPPEPALSAAQQALFRFSRSPIGWTARPISAVRSSSWRRRWPSAAARAGAGVSRRSHGRSLCRRSRTRTDLR